MTLWAALDLSWALNRPKYTPKWPFGLPWTSLGRWTRKKCLNLNLYYAKGVPRRQNLGSQRRPKIIGKSIKKHHKNETSKSNSQVVRWASHQPWKGSFHVRGVPILMEVTESPKVTEMTPIRWEPGGNPYITKRPVQNGSYVHPS